MGFKEWAAKKIAGVVTETIKKEVLEKAGQVSPEAKKVLDTFFKSEGKQSDANTMVRGLIEVGKNRFPNMSPEEALQKLLALLRLPESIQGIVNGGAAVILKTIMEPASANGQPKDAFGEQQNHAETKIDHKP